MTSKTTADGAARKGGVGPLQGVRVLEFAAIGPSPFCAMLLADLGAEVLRVDRPSPKPSGFESILNRGRPTVGLDLKSDAGRTAALDLAGRADLLLEGFRPGVMERLGLGPDAAHARNPRLVYGRMTGWGQSGPLAEAAGHDLNYVALTGALHAIGSPDKPTVPLNLVGDFGGGGLYLAMGLLSAYIHAQRTGEGQVVDCAMIDGAASLMSFVYGFMGEGRWKDERRANLLDGGAPFYDTYQCSCGGWITLGSLEPQFFAEMCTRLGLELRPPEVQMDCAHWPKMREEIAAVIAKRSREDWCTALEGTDVCFAPVLSMTEAPRHPHNQARGNFVEIDGVTQPAPAPRFSATPGSIKTELTGTALDLADALERWEN